nr:hypothetical protein [uncultured Fusobacterium sp.]
MKRTDLEKLIKETSKNIGEYASGTKIADTFNLSLSYVYSVVKNNKIGSRKKYGRNEYKIEDFLNLLELGINEETLKNPLSKEEQELNNFFNWDYQTKIEEFLMTYLLENYGEFISAKDLTKIFGMSKNFWYEYIDAGKMVYMNLGKRKIIFTRSLLPFFREALEEKE